MTSSPNSPPPSILAEADARNAALLRRCVLALIVVGILCLVVAAVAQGWFGFWGAAIGVVMVLVFFGVDVIVLRATRYTPPVQVLAVVAMVYMLKITLLAIFLVTLRGTDAFSVRAFGATVMLLTLVALAVAVVLVAKRQVLLVDPDEATSVQDPNAGIDGPGVNGPGSEPPASVES
jgi:ATP synthase protein I